MKWPKRRKQAIIPSMGAQIALIIPEIMTEIRRQPIPVKHEIIRRIPRPTMVTMIAEDDQGRQYRNNIDLSYKQTMRVYWPLDFFTGRNEDRGRKVNLHMILEYDPRDRT